MTSLGVPNIKQLITIAADKNETWEKAQLGGENTETIESIQTIFEHAFDRAYPTIQSSIRHLVTAIESKGRSLSYISDEGYRITEREREETRAAIKEDIWEVFERSGMFFVIGGGGQRKRSPCRIV